MQNCFVDIEPFLKKPFDRTWVEFESLKFLKGFQIAPSEKIDRGETNLGIYRHHPANVAFFLTMIKKPLQLSFGNLVSYSFLYGRVEKSKQ